MKYSSGRAFRQAVEAHLRELSRRQGLPLIRLRELVAFERFLARLKAHQPGAWILKGGLALQFRLGDKARRTEDAIARPSATALRRAICATFDVRATHKLPPSLPRAPKDWERSYRPLARELGLRWFSLSDAMEAARRFLDPILSGSASGIWHSDDWSWSQIERC